MKFVFGGRAPKHRVRKRVSRFVVITAMALATTVAASVAPTPLTPVRPAEAAATTECPVVTDSVGRLYSAYFLRQPDAGGRSFWVGEMQSGRRGLLDISDFFAVSPEFRTRYDSLTNAQFVDQIYRNVLGRPADAAGSSFWVDQLDSGDLSRGAVMLNFSESEEFVIKTQTSPPLAGYFSWYPSGTTYVCGTGSFSLTTAGRANLDVFATAFSTSESAGGWITLVTESDRGAERFSQTYLPTGYFHLEHAAGDRPSTDRLVQVSADPEIGVTIVSYDGPKLAAFDDRAGWGADERPPTAAEFTGDIDAAIAVADTFWRLNFSSLFTGDYVSPKVTGLYDGTDPGAPFCGRFQLLANNAFYCPIDNSVAWDVGLMADGYAFGDAWVYLVVTHEWAHAIQVLLDPALVWVGAELQADCLAGATLFGSRPSALFTTGDGASLVFEPGDQLELEAGLTALGDRVPWTDSRSHGTAEQRIWSFELGRDGGVLACMPVLDDPEGFRAPATSTIFG